MTVMAAPAVGVIPGPSEFQRPYMPQQHAQRHAPVHEEDRQQEGRQVECPGGQFLQAPH